MPPGSFPDDGHVERGSEAGHDSGQRAAEGWVLVDGGDDAPIEFDDVGS